MKQQIAVVQMDVFFGVPSSNIAYVKEIIHQLMSSDNPPDVIVLPELWTTGYDLEHLTKIGDPNGIHTQTLFSTLTQTYHVNIVAGSIPKVTNSGIYNTLYAFNRLGQLIGEYSKLHLIQLMNEHKSLTSGDKLGNFNLDGIPSAGLICYDIRFPEWVRKTVLAGAEVLYVPAEWPIQRLSHWRNLLIARAIENQCYVVACNRVGHDPHNQFAGHSMVISPWGDVLAEAGEDNEILKVEIDTEEIQRIRSTIPVFADRRPDLY